MNDHMELLAVLAGHRGEDLSDRQTREEIYGKVIRLPKARDALRAAVETEPDLALAGEVVLALLDQLPPQERGSWLVWPDDIQREIASVTFQVSLLEGIAAVAGNDQIRSVAARRLQAMRASPDADPLVTFHSLAQAVQETAALAPWPAGLEPAFEQALRLLQQHPDLRPQFEAELISLLAAVKPGVRELIAFLMHELRWPAVESAIRKSLGNPPDASYPRAYHSMLQAFSDTWPDRDLYKRYE